MNLTIERTTLDRVPERLLRQKDWDLNLVLDEALADTDWRAYAIYVGANEEPAALFCLSDNAFHRGITIDTLIIDRTYRSPRLAKAVVRIACFVAQQEAKQRGHTHVFFETDHPKVYERLFPEFRPERLGVVMRAEVH